MPTPATLSLTSEIAIARQARGQRLSDLALEAARRLGYTLTAAGRPGEARLFLQQAVSASVDKIQIRGPP